MVYYFTSTVTDPPAIIYVGKDKVENEELIKYGWEEDVWYDNLSSAHIYLRLAESQKWDELPKELIEDCAQLTKANSIEGNKRDNVTVIYTPWSNLKKDGGMAVGQVGFFNSKLTKKLLIPTRTNAIINRLNKTKTEIPPPASTSHLREEKEAHLSAKRKILNESKKKEVKDAAKLAKDRKEEKEKGEAEWEALYGASRVEEEGRGNWEGWDDDGFM